MFSKRLKLLRKEAGLTQIELARHLGVAKGTVAMWEIGKRTPKYQSLKCLVEVLDTNIEYLLGIRDEEIEIKPEIISGCSKKAINVQAEVIYSCDDYDLILVKKH